MGSSFAHRLGVDSLPSPKWVYILFSLRLTHCWVGSWLLVWSELGSSFVYRSEVDSSLCPNYAYIVELDVNSLFGPEWAYLVESRVDSSHDFSLRQGYIQERVLDQKDFSKRFHEFSWDSISMPLISPQKFLLYDYLLVVSRRFYVFFIYIMSQRPPVILELTHLHCLY